MKKTKNLFIKISSAAMFLILALVIILSVNTAGQATAFAASDKRTGLIEEELTSVSSIKAESTFASVDLINSEENFYNLYNGNIQVDLSEEAEEYAIQNAVYPLETEPYFPENTLQPNSVIGTDERTKVTSTTTYPNSAICHITIRWKDGASSVGTAWMYYDNIAITAGHCVYSASHGGWASSIEVRPAANGSYSPYGTVYATKLHTATKYMDNANWEYDYGVIELSSDIGKSTGYFGTSWTILSLKNTQVTITGYPGEYYREMWTMGGKVTKSTTRKVYYSIDTTGGQSGSPVFKSDNRVIAIHAYGTGSSSENSATRITSGVFNFFKSFR